MDEQKKALFNVVISDETMAFEGVKVGMKKNTAHKKLISKGWYITDNSNEDIAYYEKEDAGELFWVGFENGLVRAIEYVPVDDSFRLFRHPLLSWMPKPRSKSLRLS